MMAPSLSRLVVVAIVVVDVVGYCVLDLPEAFAVVVVLVVPSTMSKTKNGLEKYHQRLDFGCL